PLYSASRIGGMDVFRLDRVTKQIRNTRTDLLGPQELAMVPFLDDDGDEENPDDQLPHLSDGEYVDPQEDQTAATDRYVPGVEEPHDLWRQRGRKVDPIFAQPVFFKLRED
ncbi:MAG: hypothetical protein HC883_02160, partial [Bdellovibrionaceae bacterium]|nr:hypothetical protein [Pseudobdellovibrionaceae bacterium]